GRRRLRRGGGVLRRQRGLPRRCEEGGGHGVHGRRQRLHGGPVRRVERHLPASGGERRDGVPRVDGGVRPGGDVLGDERHVPRGCEESGGHGVPRGRWVV